MPVNHQKGGLEVEVREFWVCDDTNTSCCLTNILCLDYLNWAQKRQIKEIKASWSQDQRIRKPLQYVLCFAYEKANYTITIHPREENNDLERKGQICLLLLHVSRK